MGDAVTCVTQHRDNNQTQRQTHVLRELLFLLVAEIEFRKNKQLGMFLKRFLCSYFFFEISLKIAVPPLCNIFSVIDGEM